MRIHVVDCIGDRPVLRAGTTASTAFLVHVWVPRRESFYGRDVLLLGGRAGLLVHLRQWQRHQQ